MYATYIRTQDNDSSRIDSYNLTREQALANARWAVANAESIVVDTPEGEWKWIKRTGKGWKFNRYPNI